MRKDYISSGEEVLNLIHFLLDKAYYIRMV